MAEDNEVKDFEDEGNLCFQSIPSTAYIAAMRVVRRAKE